MLMVLCMRVCEVQKNLSCLDTPDRANHVEYACLDRFVRNLSPYYIANGCTKNKNEDYLLLYKTNLHSCSKKSG